VGVSPTHRNTRTYAHRPPLSLSLSLPFSHSPYLTLSSPLFSLFSSSIAISIADAACRRRAKRSEVDTLPPSIPRNACSAVYAGTRNDRKYRARGTLTFPSTSRSRRGTHSCRQLSRCDSRFNRVHLDLDAKRAFQRSQMSHHVEKFRRIENPR